MVTKCTTPSPARVDIERAGIVAASGLGNEGRRCSPTSTTTCYVSSWSRRSQPRRGRSTAERRGPRLREDLGAMQSEEQNGQRIEVLGAVTIPIVMARSQRQTPAEREAPDGTAPHPFAAASRRSGTLRPRHCLPFFAPTERRSGRTARDRRARRVPSRRYGRTLHHRRGRPARDRGRALRAYRHLGGRVCSPPSSGIMAERSAARLSPVTSGAGPPGPPLSEGSRTPSSGVP